MCFRLCVECIFCGFKRRQNEFISLAFVHMQSYFIQMKSFMFSFQIKVAGADATPAGYRVVMLFLDPK